MYRKILFEIRKMKYLFECIMKNNRRPEHVKD